MNKEQIIKDTKLFLFDMDGTLWLGNQLYPFTKELLSVIRQTGRNYMFMTNNSSKSAKDYVKKLDKLGIEGGKESDFISSSQATFHYLKQNGFADTTLYVMGTRSLIAEFEKEGFIVTQNIDDAGCIVLGFDTELTFKKLEDVSRTLLTREIPYIATHPDMVCPTEYGSVPDLGSFIDMLENATGKRPKVIGKPEPLMPLLAMELYGVTANETTVVGDRIYTDVACGLNAGANAFLVMSGETTKEILDASERKPTAVLEDAGEILSVLKQEIL